MIKIVILYHSRKYRSLSSCHRLGFYVFLHQRQSQEKKENVKK